MAKIQKTGKGGESYKSNKVLSSHKKNRTNIVYKENTPEEILDATNEMLLILENKKYLNNSEIALQNKFWELLPKSNFIYARFITVFLSIFSRSGLKATRYRYSLSISTLVIISFSILSSI